MSIIRKGCRSKFTVVPNALINDKSVKLADKMILITILSKPDDWHIAPRQLATELDVGQGLVYEALGRLRDSGYVDFRRFPTGHTEWVATDSARPHNENRDMAPDPHHENPHMENPHEGFHDVLLKTEANQDYSEQKTKPPKTRARATQIPDDFELTESMREFYLERLPHGDITATFQHFTDHHRAKGSLMKDWAAAWRTWVGNELKFSTKGAYRNVNRTYVHHTAAVAERAFAGCDIPDF